MVLAAGLIVWLRQQQIVQREAFQALAARRGWSLMISGQKLGRPAMMRLSARSGSGWQTESRLDAGDAPGTRSFLTTVFAAEDPHWAEGTLVLTPDPAVMLADGAQSPGAAPGQTLRIALGRSQQTLDTRVALALAPAVHAQLQPWPAPPGLLVQASQNPEHRFDLDALAKLVDGWEPQRRSTDGLPVIVLGPDGFRVQVSQGMRRAAQMEQFVDFSLALIRVI